jgi:hypothetical protein
MGCITAIPAEIRIHEKQVRKSACNFFLATSQKCFPNLRILLILLKAVHGRDQLPLCAQKVEVSDTSIIIKQCDQCTASV